MAEAARITRLIESSPAFSFIRLGDMELGLLLGAQEKVPPNQPVFAPKDQTNGTLPIGCPGIGLSHITRLLSAFQSADYVDFHERLWPIGPLLPRLKLERPSHLHRNPDRATSYILLTWMEKEFQSYCNRHRVGFCGAEASILQFLQTTKVFRQTAKSYWPTQGTQFFHQPRENGANLDRNLDIIKTDLVAFVRETGIDTLFLSLGGGAKILCYELAQACGIRCVDFGAMLRSLCYLGSDGHHAGRSTHSPFYYRLPFDLVMDAVESALPGLPPEVLLAKAHAQLILELQKKQQGWTSASNDYDFSSTKRKIFAREFARFHRRYRGLFRLNAATRLERKRFLHFCGKFKLTWEGRCFFVVFQAKSILAKLRPRSLTLFLS